MATRKHDDRTADLFAMPVAPAPVEGSMQIAAEVCGTLTAMIDAATKAGIIRSRYDLAARMSELTGCEITKAQIDAWTGASKSQWRFPLEYGPAFEVACDSNGLQELFARKRGTRVLAGPDSLLTELGRVHADLDGLKKLERQLKARVVGGRKN